MFRIILRNQLRLQLNCLEKLGYDQLVQHGYFCVLVYPEDVVVAELALVLTDKVRNVQRELLEFFASRSEPLLKLVLFLILDETAKWILRVGCNHSLVENQNTLKALLIILSN